MKKKIDQLSYLILTSKECISDQLKMGLCESEVSDASIQVIHEFCESDVLPPCDFVFIEGSLPLIERLLKHNAEGYSVIVLLDSMDFEQVNRVIEAGAQDVLLKSELTSDQIKKCIVTNYCRNQHSKNPLSTLLLNRADERSNQLFFNSPIPKWVVAEGTLKILEANKSAVLKLGYSHSDFLNMTLPELGMSEDKLNVKLKELDGANQSIELGMFTQLTSAGKEIYIQAYAHCLEFNNRRVFLIACQDMTSLFDSKRALHESNERYKYALKATSDAIWDLDLKSNRLYFADNFELLFGHKRSDEETNLKLWEELIHPEDVKDVLNSLNEALADNEMYWKESYRFRRADGTYAHVTDKGYILRNHLGTGYRMIGALQDHTRQWQMENLLKRSNHMARLGHWELNVITGTLHWSEMTKYIHGVGIGYVPNLEDGIQFYKEGADRDHIREQFDATLTGKLVSWEQVAILITTSGEEKWVRTIGEGEFVDGKCVRVFGSIQDISDRMEIELHLKAQNLKYELAMNARSIGVWDWDIKNNVLEWDVTMFDLFGVEKGDSTKNEYKLWYNTLHPDDRERSHLEVQEAIRERKPLNSSFRIIFKDKSVHYIRAHAQIITDQNDEPYRMVGINYDFTDEVLKQNEIEQAKQEREEILESITDGFFAVDNNWNVTYWNKAAETILNIQRENITGRNLSIIFSNIKSLGGFSRLKSQLDSGKVHSFEQFFPSLSKWVSVTVYPKNDGWSVFFKDITEQKNHVDQLVENTLRSQERERNRIAKELHDGVVQQMTACSIHANHIKSIIDKPGKITDRMNGLIDMLEKATMETRNLSHNLHSPEIENNNLFELIESLVYQLNSLEKTRFHFIRKDKDANDFSDLEKVNLYRIIQELCNNILKHSNAKNGWIEFSSPNNLLKVLVKDDGQGFDYHALSQSGIGLKNILDRIHKMGGEIDFNTPGDGGLCVEIQLNRKQMILSKSPNHLRISPNL